MVAAMGLKPKKPWMKPERFRSIVEKLGISQRELAARLDYSPNQITNFATGAAVIPRVLAIFLEAVVADELPLPKPSKRKP